jgi:tripartite-type tricarboxylate transporter receptor subunit TctC
MNRQHSTRKSSFLTAVLLALLGVSGAFAQDFPTKPIRILVPYTPGTQSDVVARMIAVPLGDRLKQQVIVDNRPGAGGTIGISALKASPPDGYTMGVLVSANAVQPWIRKDMPFDIRKDFAPITLMYYSPLVMTVSASFPAKTLAEFIAYARSNPGKVFFGSTGIGTTTHLSGELLNQAAGISMSHVPMKGSPELYPPIFSGDLQVAYDGLTTPRAFIDAGKLRVIAVTSKRRMSVLPQVPAIDETYPGFDVSAWTGLAAPAGTPRDIHTRLTNEIRAIIQSPEMNKRIADLGVEPGGNTAAEFTQLISDNYEKFGRAIQAAGIKPE